MGLYLNLHCVVHGCHCIHHPINLHHVLSHTASTELVFVNFYADWCHFSNMLSPVWDKAADLVTEKLGNTRVTLGKVDCDQQGKMGRLGDVRRLIAGNVTFRRGPRGLDTSRLITRSLR